MPQTLSADDRMHSNDATRGRDARKPQEIPVRGWIDIAMRVKDQLTKDNASIIAAGLALYSLLAIFPALTACVLLYSSLDVLSGTST